MKALQSALIAGLLLSACEETSQAQRTDAPGRAVVVLDRGERVFEQYEGMADLQTGAALTCRTPMRIASLTKAITAVAVLQLAETGALSFDDRISTILPEFAEHWPDVTIQDLLHHTSGLPHHSLMFMNSGQVVYDGANNDFLFAPAGSRTDDFMPTNEDVARLLSQSATPRFARGDAFEYSNAGYVLLAQIIETVSEERYAAYLRRAIFSPLGMEDAGVHDELRPQPEGAAHSYLVSEAGFEERDYSPFNLIHGDGGVYASLCDLIAWRRAFEPNVLLGQASLDLLATPARLGDGSVITETPRGAGYSMGWFLQPLNGETVLLHGGGWAQFRHAIYFAPKRDLWVVVLTNRSDTQPYAEAEALLREFWGDGG